MGESPSITTTYYYKILTMSTKSNKIFDKGYKGIIQCIYKSRKRRKTKWKKNKMEEKQSNGLAIASMVLGIVSLILTCILPYVSWVLAIVGIVLAAIAKKKAKSGMATAGLVCSIIALAVWVVVIILLVVVGVSVGLAG